MRAGRQGRVSPRRGPRSIAPRWRSANAGRCGGRTARPISTGGWPKNTGYAEWLDATGRHRLTDDSLPELPAGAFAKQDTGDDLAFYAPPRLVTHIDEGAVAALTACYRALLPENSRVLDLMSSWVSHLPSDRTYAAVVGHGMNADELAANPRLDRWFVQDLNRDATLPLDDGSFDAALCCVGAQYLQQPVAVFAEVRRVLTPAGPVHRQLLEPLLFNLSSPHRVVRVDS